MTVTPRTLIPFLLIVTVIGVRANAQSPDPQLAKDLKRLSIEELTQLDITTASRRVEPLAPLNERAEPGPVG